MCHPYIESATALPDIFFSHFPLIFNLSLKLNIYFVVGSYNEYMIFTRSNTCIRTRLL